MGDSLEEVVSKFWICCKGIYVLRFLLMYYSFSVQLSDSVLRRIMYIDGTVQLHATEEAEYH